MDGGSESVRMALCKWGRHPSIAPVIMGDGRAACGPPGTEAAILGTRCLLLEPEKRGGGEGMDRVVEGSKRRRRRKRKKEGRACHGIIPSHAPLPYPHLSPAKKGEE